MKRTHLALLGMALVIAACASHPSPTPTTEGLPARPTRTPPPTATVYVAPTRPGTPEEEQLAYALPVYEGEWFSTSGICARCHTDMVDEANQDVSIDTQWRSSMMANAAVDPFFGAVVAREALPEGSSSVELENSCAVCHMPMASVTRQNQGETLSILGTGALNPENEAHVLAIDGVSCTACHQIREENLGPPSYNGRFEIDDTLPAGERLAFGPYNVEESEADIMQSASGFIPTLGLQIIESRLCATCHTVYVDDFPQQVPYLEWYYSAYRRTDSCQSCHMPEAVGGVRVSNVSGSLRSPFAQHAFLGGNVLLLSLLGEHGEDLGASASASNFDMAQQQALQQLQENTAKVALEEVSLTGSWLNAAVSIENLAGHKLPTAFPSRRVWIHFSVRDSSGTLAFESGGYESTGRISGNDQDDDPSSYEPHYEAIVSSDQVQIYEVIIQGLEGGLTTSLRQPANILKDNRLLPLGFEKGAPYEDIAVRGRAMDDVDFIAGSDRVQFTVNLGEGESPFTISVELCYQPISYRWVDDLRDREAPEINAFISIYDSLDKSPIILAQELEQIGQ